MTDRALAHSAGMQNDVALVEATLNCALCPRLSAFLAQHRVTSPEWHNAPVRSFGPETARLLIVGLAPGLKGANRTGRPFTGDYAGDLLYATLIEYGFSQGIFEARADDSLSLNGCMITNAVRCVPPDNKPTPAEIKTCRQFLSARIAALPNLSVIVALGRIAHQSTVAAFGLKQKDFMFAHGAKHAAPNGVTLFDSYHCSRYNTNTGVLTTEMFRRVFADVQKTLGS